MTWIFGSGSIPYTPKLEQLWNHMRKDVNFEISLKKTNSDVFRVYKETLPNGKQAIMAVNKHNETFINKHFDDISTQGANPRSRVRWLLAEIFGDENYR